MLAPAYLCSCDFTQARREDQKGDFVVDITILAPLCLCENIHRGQKRPAVVCQSSRRCVDRSCIRSCRDVVGPCGSRCEA